MQEVVDAQRGPACERLAAVLAHIRFLATVEDHVLFQVPLQAIALVAVRAGKGTHAAVTHLKITSVSLARQCFLFTDREIAVLLDD